MIFIIKLHYAPQKLFDFKTMGALLEKAGYKDIHVVVDSPRPFPLSFALTRGADYFPWAAGILKPIGKFLDHFDILRL